MSWDFGGDASSTADDDDWGEASQKPGPSRFSPGLVAQDIAQHSTDAGDQTQSAPVLFLVVGLVLATASTAIALVADSATLASVGWVLGGPLAIGSLAVFLQIDTRRRLAPWYAETALVPWLRRGLVFLAILAVALNAWTIANAVARGTWS
jgi:hypothetical protein